MELQQIAEQAGRDLEGASAQDVLRWAVDTFGDRFVIASSMGDGLLAHLASSVASGVDVLFLDTGYHFAETIGTRDAVAQVYDVNVRTVLPLLTVAAAGRRARRAAVRARPRRLLRPAQGRAARPRRSSRTPPGRPASAATRRRPAATSASSSGTPSARW